MLSACAANRGSQSDPAPADLRGTLQAWLTGSFSSQKQSEKDPTFFDIRLHIVPIWTDRADGPWLYVEQARADMPEQPYRQRVYRLSRLDADTYRSDVYEFASDPLRVAGAWKLPAPLADLTPNDLNLKQGCEVLLTWKPLMNAFVGGTSGTTCPSALRGASYATSEVTLTRGALNSWDRGYDAAGQQVWGAVSAGYQFDRVTP